MENPSTARESLISAIESCRTDIVRSVLATLEDNAKTTDENSTGETLDILSELCCEAGTHLHLATKLDQVDSVRALLAAGADPGVHNTDGKTPFDLVQSKQVIEVYNHELLQSTAQGKVHTKYLHVQFGNISRAAISKLTSVGRVCQLLAAGLDINLVDSREGRNTPLHWAATYSTWEMVQCLCSRGASVCSVNAAGFTPLHDAVKRGNLQVIEELLVFEADPKVMVTEGKDKGQNAFDLATNNPEVLNLLNNPPERVILEDFDSRTQKPGKLDRISSSTSTGTLDAIKENTLNGPISESSGLKSPELTSPGFEKGVGYGPMTDPPKPVITDETLGLLWPQPQMILQKDGRPFCPLKNMTVFITDGPHKNVHEVMKRWEMRRDVFKDVGVQLTCDLLSQTADYHTPHIICHVNPRLCTGPGSYRINITHKQLKVLCDDLKGLNFAIATLVQLFRLYHADDVQIPLLQIDDWPEFRVRGILVDISQGRTPNLASLKSTINCLSLLKISQVHLYSRFKDTGTPDWQLCYSRSEILELEQYCLLRSVQLVPVIEVTPTTCVEDVNNLYTAFHGFISSFTESDFVSVGPRLSSFILDTSDDESLNINDALKYLPIGRHQTMMLCGYPLHDIDPVLLQQLPPDLVFMQYGVQADHNFKKFSSPLAETGSSFCICPGTSAWNSLAGCPEAAVSNVFSGVRSAVDQGAIGVIVCDWSGKGYLTHQPFSWPAYLIGSGLAWNSDTHWDYLHTHLAELLNHHVFRDKKSMIGRTVIELGRAETYVLRVCRNQLGTDCSKLPDEHGSTLFQLLMHPNEVSLENLSLDALQKSVRHVKRCQLELSNAEPNCYNHTRIVKELQLTSDLMLSAIRLGRSLLMIGRNPSKQSGYAVINLGITNLPATAKTDLANKLLELLSIYKSVWKEGYLTRGLHESVHTLQNLLKQLVPEEDGTIYNENQD